MLIVFNADIGFPTPDGMHHVNTGLDRVYLQTVEPLQPLKVVADKHAIDIVDAAHTTRNGYLDWQKEEASVNAANTVINRRRETFRISSPAAEEQLSGPGPGDPGIRWLTGFRGTTFSRNYFSEELLFRGTTFPRNY